MIDREIENAVAVGGEFTRTADKDGRRIRVLSDRRDQSAVILLRHRRFGIAPPLQTFRSGHRSPFKVNRSAGFNAHSLAALELNLGAEPLLFELYVESANRVSPLARRIRRLAGIARRASFARRATLDGRASFARIARRPSIAQRATLFAIDDQP